MATNAAEIEFIPDEEIDFVPDEPIDFVPDQPVDVNQEAARSTAGALQAIDLATLPGKLDWSEAAADEVNTLREQAAAQFQARNAPAAQKLSSQAMRLDEKLQQEAPQSTGAQRLRGQYQNLPQPNVEGFQGANFLGRGLSQIAQTVGLTPLAHNIEQAGQSPIGLNFQANIGGAIGGAAGAAAMMVPGGQGLGASSLAPMLAPLAGGLFGGLAGGAGQEVIQRATETPEETGARHEALAETERESPFASALGRAVTNAPFMRPSLSVISEAMAGNKTAQAAVAAAGGIGAAMGAGGALLQGQKPSLAGIAESALSNLIFNKPTRLGRALGLPAVETGRVEEQTGFEPITIEPDAQQISETSPPDGGVRAPEVPITDAIVPTDESGAGVQPSGQGESLAEAAPETPREVAPEPAPEATPEVTPEPTLEPSPAAAVSEIEGATSIKNAVTSAERAAREISQPTEPDQRAWTEAWDAAKADIAENPAAVDVLLTELRNKPRALNDKQDAMLLHRQIDLQKAYDSAAEAVNRAAETGDEPMRVEAKTRLDAARDALQDLYDIGKRAGTETGRGLNARKMWANQDYNLVAMETRLRADQGGALSEKQLAEVKSQAETIKNTQAEMDKILAEREFQKQAAEADKTVDPQVKSLADRIIARLDLTAKNAATSLRSKLNNLGSAPDPTIIVDVAKIAAAKTAKGAVKFAQWSAEMIAEFGEKVRPFLQAGWDQREKYIDAEVNTGTKQARSKEKASESVRRENAKVKALARSIKQAEAELAGAAKRGKQLGPESQAVTEAREKLKVLREEISTQRAPEIRQAKMEAAEAAVEKAIAKLDEQLQSGDFSIQQRRTKEGSQRLEDLRMQRDAMNRLKNELRRPKADPVETQVKTRLSSLANRTAEYERRTAAGDFSPMRKPAMDLSKNPEWVKLKAENDSAKAAYEKARYEARKAQRTIEQKVRDTVADVWAASRPILASTDISAPGRQGIFFALPDLFSNPVRLGRQLKSMFRSQFNESKFQQNEAAIKSRDNADLYESSDLYLADIDHKPSAREEQFKSELAEKIPGIGRIVRGSSRGFTSFMNTVRADAMDSFVKWSGGKENLTPETAKFLASAINDLSGRGNISSRKAQGAMEWLATYLFSPRLWVSRFNTALLKPIWRDPLNRAISPRARAVVAGQYAKFAGALLALKWLAGLNGGKMEEDPRDSDFGKLQFGSKRYDVMGGIGNMVTFLARLASGKTKDDKGKIQSLVWEDKDRPDRDLGLVIFQHLRNKMAPIPGALYDLRYGRHPDRSKVTPKSMVKQTVVPITVSDTIEYFKQQGPIPALRDTFINALGISTQDYRKK